MVLLSLAATVLSVSMHVVDNLPYYHHTKTEKDRISTTVTYRQEGNYLVNKARTRSAYDEENRLISRETERWNTSAKRWERRFKYVFSYTPDGYAIEFLTWNEHKKRYIPAQKAEYRGIRNHVVSIQNYEWNEKAHSFTASGNPALVYQSATLYAGINSLRL
ncbi:DUF3836 domain-containing protein [Phocaeicola abscessus]|uniref:DUF3836 domain-containing protein n=1 Tax=Phocaeicola abscessus TaxID=555313 RepID=UPI000A02932E|nr:DUF3836 domain-containing protein [Phocaeicola abscessus]